MLIRGHFLNLWFKCCPHKMCVGYVSSISFSETLWLFILWRQIFFPLSVPLSSFWRTCTPKCLVFNHFWYTFSLNFHRKWHHCINLSSTARMGQKKMTSVKWWKGAGHNKGQLTLERPENLCKHWLAYLLYFGLHSIIMRY